MNVHHDDKNPPFLDPFYNTDNQQVHSMDSYFLNEAFLFGGFELSFALAEIVFAFSLTGSI